MLAIVLYCLAALVASFFILRYSCPRKAGVDDVAFSLMAGWFWPFVLAVFILIRLCKTLAKLYNKRYS